MKIKQIPEDFLVEEIYDVERFKQKEDSRKYHYFILTKKDYTQMRALDIVADVFGVSKKNVHFAGTKDKVGITKQVISINIRNETNLEKNINYLNENIKDIDIEPLGVFNGRINLGDNLGNKFTIVVRYLTVENIEKAKINLENIRNEGALNYFDDQRFGFANNSHIIGKYILKNDPKSAVYEILTSAPQNPSDDLLRFSNYIKDNFEEIANANEIVIDKAVELVPKFFRDAKDMLMHLKKYKNDFPGSFRKLHKKLRTLYINAYQSYIFNQTLDELSLTNQLDNYSSIPLVTQHYLADDTLTQITEKLLQKDDITKEDFILKSMPELSVKEQIERDTKIMPDELLMLDEENDELNESMKKVTITFKLPPGAYATNIIKQVFR